MFVLMCNSYPVIHVFFSLCRQHQRPPLFSPLNCVHSKGIVAVPEHRNQCRHFIYKHMEVLKDTENENEKEKAEAYF